MKEKIYIGKSLAEIEALAVKELGVSKDDMYFDVIDENVDSRDEIQVHVMVDANPVKKGKDFLETFSAVLESIYQGSPSSSEILATTSST